MHSLAAFAVRLAGSPRWVAAGLTVILAASFFLSLRLQVSADISSLMPEHSRLSGALLRTLDDFGSTDRLILVVQSTRADDAGFIAHRRELKEFADHLVAGMGETGLFSAITHRVTPAQREFFDDLHFRYPFHFLSADRRQAVKHKLTAEEIDRRVDRLARSLRASPMGAAAQPGLLRDPLGFRSNPLHGADNQTGFKLDLSDGYFFSVDGASILILAEPAAPSQDTAFDARLLRRLELLLSGAGGSGHFHQDYSMPIGDAFVVRLFGPYVETLYGSEAARKELLPSVVGTCLGLLILFALVYRSALLILVLAVPLLAGIAMTSGMAALFAGHLTMMTVGFATMLAGLGVDFEIHLVERIGQEALGGRDPADSIATAIATAGRGVLAGGLSTAAIFLLIATSDFDALQEFGWIMGLGILLTMACVFLLLPTLISAAPAVVRPPARSKDGRWADWIICHYRFVVLLGAALTLGLGYAASALQLQGDIYRLGPMNPGYERSKDQFLDLTGGSTNVVMVVSEQEEFQDLLVQSERIETILQDLQSRGEIDAYESLSSILPSRRAQQETMLEVRQWNLAGTMANFESALGQAGFRVTAFEPFIQSVLAYDSDDDRFIGRDEFVGTPAEPLLDRLLLQQENSWRAVTYIYPPPGKWQQAVPAAIVEQLEGLGTGIVVTGIVPVFNEISVLVREEFVNLTLFALMAILIISAVFFKQASLSVLSVVPAIFGLTWTLGLMQLLGIELNLVTMLVAPMILGLGVDDALHIMIRHQETPGRLARSMAAVTQGVLMTSATTIIGFGSLAFADLPSLRALGLTVSLGMLCCTAASLLLLPALLTLVDSRR